MKDLDFDVSNYKINKYSDKQEENMLSNTVSYKQDNSVLLNQIKSLKEHVNSLQYERDQLERKYQEKLEEDNEVHFNNEHHFHFYLEFKYDNFV